MRKISLYSVLVLYQAAYLNLILIVSFLVEMDKLIVFLSMKNFPMFYDRCKHITLSLPYCKIIYVFYGQLRCNLKKHDYYVAWLLAKLFTFFCFVPSFMPAGYVPLICKVATLSYHQCELYDTGD